LTKDEPGSAFEDARPAGGGQAGSPEGLPAISARTVKKSFGRVTALDGVSLEVGEGELMSLLGPSGSGKTTLLNIFAGFLRPDSGVVAFRGEDVTLRPPHKRDVGFVFQHYALFPHMSVGENIAYPLRIRKTPRDEIARRIAWSLETVQLAGYEDRGVEQLSGGQKQRVALARAIVFEPQVILMDEPLSALDKQLRERMQIELRNLHERLGATTVYVTHDQREALTLSDRVAVMDHGRMMQLGTPEQLYEEPANRFVADFVGETTLLPVERLDSHAVRFAGAPFATRRGVPAEGPHHLAIRTEKLLLLGPGEEPETNVAEGRVTGTVYQGESMRIFVDLADGTGVSLRRLCQGGDGPAMPEKGDTVRLHLPPENTVVVTD
jgi:putative spermidine/putrescine transport system ATP-binding protein